MNGVIFLFIFVISIFEKQRINNKDFIHKIYIIEKNNIILIAKYIANAIY